jgi:hypothetical protein
MRDLLGDVIAAARVAAQRPVLAIVASHLYVPEPAQVPVRLNDRLKGKVRAAPDGSYHHPALRFMARSQARARGYRVLYIGMMT